MDTWKTYQGIEVIEFDSEVKVRHPRWGYDQETLATLTGATLLGLADGVFLVVCDKCGYNGITGREPYVKPEGEQKTIIKQADSLLGHINGMHHPGKSDRQTSSYSEEQIKLVILTYLKWKRTQAKNWRDCAANELSAMGFKPSRRDAWTGHNVSTMSRRYLLDPRFAGLEEAFMIESRRIADLVRESAERQTTDGRSNVAATARITETRQRDTPAAATHEVAEPKKGADVPTKNPATPTFSFSGQQASPPPATFPISKPQVVAPNPLPEVQAPVLANSPVASSGGYVHIAMVGGCPMFTYEGVLMIGKPVKDVSI